MPNYPISTPGYYMPTISSYPGYPGMTFNSQVTPQQSFAPSPATSPNNQGGGVIWVDGEQAARSYQLPAGWPANTPFALWDSNEQVIYWKSVNQYGAPNKLLRIPYTMDDDQLSKQQAMPVSGTVSAAQGPDMTAYVTKDDLNSMRNEIKEMLRQSQQQTNQNGSNQGQNRGGNK